MPSLEFKGKAFVYAHHLSVPFRELIPDPEKSHPKGGPAPGMDGNLIIHGDNLEALKALLPVYAGKVDCIYIDPPYNTGNEGWCYNDNVRSPLMREWLKKAANPVEREDLERHDKWLCMMWPRLQLLHELLAEDGAIFVSIDDNEVHRLRGLMDEIFGEENFFCTFAWEKRYGPPPDTKEIGYVHESIVAYRKSGAFTRNLLPLTADQIARYKNPDNDPRGPWKAMDYTCRYTREERPNLYYAIEHPSTGDPVWPKATRVWASSKEEHETNAREKRLWWGADGKATVPAKKNFLSEIQQGIMPTSLLGYREVGHTDEATKELRDVMPDVKFTPKPVRLVEHLLALGSPRDALILDSFAGSGTTAHAVLKLNQKDSGTRRFILVEAENYADTLTAERVRRVADGYAFTGTQRTELLRDKLNWSKLKKAGDLVGKAESVAQLEGSHYDSVKTTVEDGELIVTGERQVKETTPGLGGSFTYCTLGKPMTLEALLSDGLPSFESLAKYVFFTATGRTLAALPPKKERAEGYIGSSDLYRVHLLYEPDAAWLASDAAALTEALAEHIAAQNTERKTVLVFAAAKFLSQRELSRQGLTFCQLPYAIHRLLGD